MWIIPLRLLDGASAVGTIIPPDAQPLAPVNLSIGNFYVVDFESKRRRPITVEEFALVRQWSAIYKRVKLRYARDMTANRALERQFSAQLRGTPLRKERSGGALPFPGDPSGLTPVKRREKTASRSRAARRGLRSSVR